MCQGSCLVGFSFDHRNLKTSALDVENNLTCHRLVELWWEVVNLKNEVDKKEAIRLFGEEFHTPNHIILCIENTSGLKVQNGHTKLLVVFAKLVGIIPTLACEDPFYKP
jgi:3,4-dihydroxy-2-butanone 4-phosphate synthase